MPFLEAPELPAKINFETIKPPVNVVLTRQGFQFPLIENEHFFNFIEKHVTFEYPENFHVSRFAKRKEPLKVFLINEQSFVLPKFFVLHHFSDWKEFVYTNEQWDGLDFINTQNFASNRELCETERRPQKSATTFVLNHLRKTGAAVLCLPVGCGKTVCGLYVASQLKKKTLIVAAKGDLLDQWAERINEFCPGSKIGKIQADVFDIDDCDFVLATAQSLGQKTYPVEKMEEFGLIIFDESHHTAAPTFLMAVWQISSPYMLALTADPTRSDGMTDVLYMFFSWNVFVVTPKLPKDIFLNVRVHRFTQRCYVEEADLVDEKESKMRIRKNVPVTQADKPLTALAKVDIFSEKKYTAVYKGVTRQANRNSIAAAYVKFLLMTNDALKIHPPTIEECSSVTLDLESKNRFQVQVKIDDTSKLITECTVDEKKRLCQTERQILCLTVHKEHIKSFIARLVRSGVPQEMVMEYSGDETIENRKLALSARVIVATFAMAAEGLDIPTLNTILLLCPCSNIVNQVIGRATRDRLNPEIQPCIIDLVDVWCAMTEAMYWKRHTTYKVYAPQLKIEFYNDDRTDSVVGAFCQKREIVLTAKQRKLLQSQNKIIEPKEKVEKPAKRVRKESVEKAEKVEKPKKVSKKKSEVEKTEFEPKDESIENPSQSNIDNSDSCSEDDFVMETKDCDENKCNEKMESFEDDDGDNVKEKKILKRPKDAKRDIVLTMEEEKLVFKPTSDYYDGWLDDM